jgi:hypothetical protein
MRRRHIAVWIVRTLVVGFTGSVAQPALAANAGAKIQKGLLDRLQAGTLDSFVVEFAARADVGAGRDQDGPATAGPRIHHARAGTVAKLPS